MISIRYRGFRASIVALVIVGVFTGGARYAHAGIKIGAMNFEIYCHATAAGPRYFHSAISKMVVNSDHFSLWRSLGSSRILDRILDEHAVEFAREASQRHDVDRLLSPRCELVAPGRGAPAIAAAAYFRGGERVSYPANRKIGVEWAPPDFPRVLASSSHVTWPRVAALVVGNSGYAHIRPRSNPAGAVAEALERLGFFDVRLLLDADKAAMDDALAAFETASEGAEVALVFYSGYGFERDGSSFVVPIDAQPGLGPDEMLPLDDIIAATAQAQARVVILDAMFSGMFSGERNQDLSGMEALERMGPSPDTQWGMNLLVAYAGLPGGDVFDGDGGTTSPYAEALLRHLNEQPIVPAMFGAVGAEVLYLTEGRQLPSVYSTLTAPVTLLQRPEPNLLDRESR